MADSPRRELHMSAGQDGDGVWLKVRDTGPGIPERQIANVFDPFFTTKEIGEGLGLDSIDVLELVLEIERTALAAEAARRYSWESVAEGVIAAAQADNVPPP
jgi:C4-dicarboxylate-specific signal transduction histidine kinase